jgi:hypothetical protein
VTHWPTLVVRYRSAYEQTASSTAMARTARHANVRMANLSSPAAACTSRSIQPCPGSRPRLEHAVEDDLERPRLEQVGDPLADHREQAEGECGNVRLQELADGQPRSLGGAVLHWLWLLCLLTDRKGTAGG